MIVFRPFFPRKCRAARNDSPSLLQYSSFLSSLQDDAVAQLNDLSLDDDDLDLEDDLTDDLEEDPESEAASATGYMARNSVPRNQRNHSRPRNTSGSGSMADSGGGGGLDEFACSDEDSALPVNKRRSRNLVTAANGVPSNLMGPAMQNGIPAYNWQATKKTIKERMAFMFNSEILADVHFVVGREANQQRIPGHRFVLSIGSAVFDAMFNSTLATKDEEITIPDVEPTAFLVLLRFIYCDEVIRCLQRSLSRSFYLVIDLFFVPTKTGALSLFRSKSARRL